MRITIFHCFNLGFIACWGHKRSCIFHLRWDSVAVDQNLKNKTSHNISVEALIAAKVTATVVLASGGLAGYFSWYIQPYTTGWSFSTHRLSNTFCTKNYLELCVGKYLRWSLSQHLSHWLKHTGGKEAEKSDVNILETVEEPGRLLSWHHSVPSVLSAAQLNFTSRVEWSCCQVPSLCTLVHYSGGSFHTNHNTK